MRRCNKNKSKEREIRGKRGKEERDGEPERDKRRF